MTIDAPSIAGALAATVLLVLALLHVYWAIRGIDGASVAIPSVDGKPLFVPSRAATVAVAVALGLAALLVLGTIGALGTRFVPHNVYRVGTSGVATAFLLRAVGEFRYVGFFKRVHGTPFAYWDTRVYSPLCVVLAVACGAAAVFS